MNDSTFSAWLRLIRLPNLLTVPGDPLAGFLLIAFATATTPPWLALAAAIGAALCLYIFGLILNDILDLEIDQEERPERPLPSGEITIPQARMAAIAVALSGLNLALVAGRTTLYVAGALAAMIILYNAYLKKTPLVGILAMGLCRALSLLLGASAVPNALTIPWMQLTPVCLAALALGLYVTAFSSIAKDEMLDDKPYDARRWLPFSVLLLALPTLWGLTSALHASVPILPYVFVFFMTITLIRSWLLGGILYHIQDIPTTTGGHIRNLIMLQACFCMVSGLTGLFIVPVLLLNGLIFPHLSKKFYAS